MQRIVNSFRKARATALIAVAGTALVTGCQDLRDTFSLKPLNGITARVSVEPAATQVTGAIVDAKTLESLGDLRVTVKISGPDAKRLVDLQGNKLDSVFTTKGSIGLYLTGDVPTLANPARVLVTITPPDGSPYLATSNNLLLTKAINDPFQVKLVNSNNPPADVNVVRGKFKVGTNGTIGSVLPVSIPGFAAIIRVKAGNTFFDESGKPLATNSEVEMLIKRGGAPVGSSVAYQDMDGKVSDVVLKLYDYYSIELKSGGKPVTFSGSDISFYVPVTESGAANIVNYDGGTGRFVNNGAAVPFQLNGNPTVALAITDVSKPIGFGKVDKNVCSGSLKVNVQNAGGSAIEGFAYGYEVEQNGVKFTGSSSSQIDFPAIQQGKAATVKFFDSEGELFATANLSDLCGSQEQTVRYAKTVVNVGFKANVTCANGKTPKLNGSDLTLALYPNVTVWYGEKGKPQNTSVVVKQGAGQLVGLKPNTTYQARVDFEGSYNYEFTTGSSDSTLEPIQVNIKSGTLVCPN